MSRPGKSARAFTWRRSVCALGLGGTLAMASACVEQADDKPTAEDLEFVKGYLLSAAPAPQFPVNADLDGKVVYLGLDVSENPIEPGKDVKVTQYWKVVSPPGPGWRVFMHGNGPGTASFLNLDHGPVKSKYPVGQWKAGDIIKDEHTIRLPPTWPHDQVTFYAGLWKGPERMAIRSGPKSPDGRIIAATVPVKTNVAAPAERKRLVARKANKPIKLDGKLDEPGWKDAPSSGAFVDTLTGAPVAQKTEVKALWDDKTLYLAFQVDDKDAWSKLDKRDDKLWQQEVVEIMVDADGNGKTYTEFQVAPNGNVFDTYLPEYRKYEDTVDPKRKQFDWNSKIKASVKVEGTLNKHDDEDKGWVAEVAIPLADAYGLQKEGVKAPPALGDVWRVNFFRFDAAGGKPQPQIASGWSPPMVGDFHALDKFGELVFGDETGAVRQAAAPGAAGAPAPEGAAAAREQAREAALAGVQRPGGGSEKPLKKRAAKPDNAAKPAKEEGAP